ncbi:MAG: hypothetical protein ACJ8J3_26115, partial [Burkholderia ambifaria]
MNTTAPSRETPVARRFQADYGSRIERPPVDRTPPCAFESRHARTPSKRRFSRAAERVLFGSARLPRGLRAAPPGA